MATYTEQMRVLLAVPSRSRADFLAKTTLPWLLHCDELDWKVFVEPHQAANYAAVIPENKIVVLPEDNRGLAFCLNYIYEVATREKYGLVFKCDDDTAGWNRRSKISEYEKSASHVQQAVRDAVAMFKAHPQLGGVGFPYGNEVYEIKKWGRLNARLQSNYIVRTKFMRIPYEHVGLWTDFYCYLKILSDGYFTLRHCAQGIRQRGAVGKLPGGMQDTNRARHAPQTRKYLQRLCPDLAWRQVNKPWQFEPDFSNTPSIVSREL